MAYRHGDRNQMQLLPPNIEEYVTPDDSVRAYSAFVDSLSLAELGILWDEHKVGNDQAFGIWLLLWFTQFSEIGNGDLS